QSCVNCHNTHPQSPKTDWQENDVRGVLEVTLPLDLANAQLSSNMQGFTWLAGLSGLVMFSVLAFVLTRLQRIPKELEHAVEQRTSELVDANEEIKHENTERRKAEKFFQVAVESVPEGILMTDSDGRIRFANSELERQFGYTHEELIGQKVEILVPDVVRHRHISLRNDYLKDPHKRPMGGELTLHGQRKDGTRFAVEIGLNPIQTDEGLMVLASIIDVTQRRLASQQLELAKVAAEAANRSKSEFLANMSHEIRTPMNAIIGMNELALDTELDHEQREYLDSVNDAAVALLELLNDILDFSKIEAGKLTLELAPFDLISCLNGALKTMAHRAFEKNVELTWELDPDIPRWLVGDSVRTRQIVLNLIGNAIKFSEAGGEVVLRAANQRDSGDRVQIKFSVSDTGIGIPREKQEEIFESFSQADASTTRRYGGTGLGLAISATLVHLMDGEIWLESELGTGSTFYFSLEFPIDKTPRTETPLIDPSAVFDLKVLVVDDNATNRQIKLRMLRNWRMRPVLVDSGEAALQAIENAQTLGTDFELVLTDCHMPEMDGFELARRLRDNPNTSSLKMIMLTSGVVPGSSEKCQELEISRLLLKPAKPSDLLEAIQATMGLSVESSPVSAPADSLPSPTGLRILLAEDNRLNQTLAQRMLEKQGHTIAIANNGKEAVEMFLIGSYDLILMDVQMPEMDGIQATRAIREHEKQSGGRIPIIALTAHAMKGDRERFMDSGMDDYVAKPMRKNELTKVMNRLI
ncbi:MAG: response regulator, partial [Pirellulaceae bacterium]